MKANFYLSPLDHPLTTAEIDRPTRLMKLFEHPEVNENDIGWLKENAAIVLDGEVIPPAMWELITVKPRPVGELNIVVVPKGKRVFAILAAVAVVALTAGIAAFGVPFLGAAFAAGSLGANVLAAGIGIAGSLLISALTAPPKAGNTGNERPTTNAGVSGNSATLLDLLPSVVGEIGVSPPLLAPPYTVWDGNQVIAYAVAGVEGRCAVSDGRINGLPLESFPGITYELREGKLADTPRTMFTQTVIEERDGVAVSNFKTKLETNSTDLLQDQTTPDNSAPQWHYFRTAGEWDKAVLRFQFPAGIAYTPTAVQAMVPLRIEIRKVGDADWRKLPTFHISDVNKGYGQMRCEIRLERIKQPAGKHYADAFGDFPIVDVCNKTGHGTSFEYTSDSYFGFGSSEAQVDSSPTWLLNMLPLFTGYTNGGYTVSASSEHTTSTRAWHCLDARDAWVGATVWRPLYTSNAFPHWWQLQSSTQKKFRSYCIFASAASGVVAGITYLPAQWYIQGSNDGTTWTNLDNEMRDYKGDYSNGGWYQIENPDFYYYYRLYFIDNQSSDSDTANVQNDLQISFISFSEYDAVGVTLNGNDISNTTVTNVVASYGSGSTYARCRYVSLDAKGARVFLDPDQWEAGEYEVRVKRGAAYYYSYHDTYASSSTTQPYRYNGSAANADYFDYRGSAGSYSIYVGQKNYRSEMNVEAFQTVSNESPFDDSGIALIAVAVPNVQVSSLYAKFSKYASVYSDGIWLAEKQVTSNPAAHYRDLLLGAGNHDPVPSEVIDEEGLADWYQVCETNGYEVNAVIQSVRVNEVKQLIATAGYATSRDSRVYGVIQDKDTTADPIRYLVTPQNSRDEGNITEIKKLPHAIRAEFNDETLSYAVNHVMVYRDGYNASNASLFETLNYIGLTTEAAVTARATFDLKQMYLRQTRYSREVGLEFLGIQKGDVVGLADDTIDGDVAAGWIKSVQTSGGNVVSITLDNIIPWSEAQEDIERVEDITSLTDVLDVSQPMGVAIRVPGQNLVYKQVSNVTDDNICTFTTPFTDDGSIVPNLLVACGRFARPVRRCKVLQVMPRGFERRLITLTDEAPELYA